MITHTGNQERLAATPIPVRHNSESRSESVSVWFHGDSSTSGSTHEEETPLLPETNHASPVNSRKGYVILVSLCLANICSSLFGSLLAPFFPEEAAMKGVRPSVVGLIFGCYQLVGFVLSPVWGAHIGYIGPKFMYICGIFVCSSCAALFGILAWCPPGWVYILMCLLCRSVEAAAGSATSTAGLTIATNTFPQSKSTVMGLLNACSCIGLMIGPPIGGLLYQLRGFYLPFVVSGVILMSSGLLGMMLIPNSIPADTVQTKRLAAHGFRLLRNPVLILVGILVLLGQVAMGFIDVSFAVHLQTVATCNDPSQAGLTATQIGLIFLIAPVVVVVLAPIFGVIADRLKILSRPILLFGGMLAALSFLGLGPSPLVHFLPKCELWIILVSLSVCGVGWAALVLTYQEFFVVASSCGLMEGLDTQGLVAGVYNSFSNLGAFIGPTVGGVMNDFLHFPWSSTAIAMAILLNVVTLILYLLVKRLLRDARPT